MTMGELSDNAGKQKKRRDHILLRKIKNRLPALRKLLAEVARQPDYEDLVYRYYHQSLKVYSIQEYTVKIVKALKDLAPTGATFNSRIEAIIAEGTGWKFKSCHNKRWDSYTRPMLEAYFHARFFLEMAVKFGEELKKAPNYLPSGWAALLYFYNMR